MSSGPAPRRGRRDNGLDALFFVPLRDVDPRVGEHLLDVLREAGIAAYLEPTSDVDSYTRAVSLPSPPSDRLWVDRTASPVASSLVTKHAYDQVLAHHPCPAEADCSVDEAVWAQIVADFQRGSDAEIPPWPVIEDVDRRPVPDPPPERAVVEPPVAGGSASRSSEPDHNDGGDTDGEGHYRPPPPPPVPSLSRPSVYALMLISLGTTLFIAPGLVGIAADAGFVLGVLGIVGGVGLLVYRMRERPPFDDGPDDGAVV